MAHTSFIDRFLDDNFKLNYENKTIRVTEGEESTAKHDSPSKKSSPSEKSKVPVKRDLPFDKSKSAEEAAVKPKWPFEKSKRGGRSKANVYKQPNGDKS